MQPRLPPSSAVGAEAFSTVRAAYEAATRNELPHFAPVANFPGFGRATAATINDLRSAAIPAETLKRLGESGPDNAALLERFEEQLGEVSVGDRAILFQAALEEVRAGADFARHPLLFLDVPIHSAIERAFIVELASATKDVLFTCPTGDLCTLDNLRMVPGVQDKAPPVVPGDSSLSRLGFYLFSEKIPPEGKPDDEVVFFSAPGEDRESVEIVRRILAEAEKGIPFDRMAVLLLAAGDLCGFNGGRPLKRAGIRCLLCAWKGAAGSLGSRPVWPCWHAPPRDFPLIASPSICRLHRFQSLGKMVHPPEQPRSSLCRPEELTRSEFGCVSFRTSDAKHITRRGWRPTEFRRRARIGRCSPRTLEVGRAFGGCRRDRWWQGTLGPAARRTAEPVSTRGVRVNTQKEEPDSPRVESGPGASFSNLRHLRAFALPVIEELSALPKSATWGEWIAAVEHLSPRVLRQPERVLAVLADLRPMGPVASVPLAEVQNVLQHWLSNLQQQPPESRYGRVLVATPEHARGRSFDIVFIPGLAERMFPQKLREDPLLLDKLRRQLSSDLSVMSNRSQQERLLLQIAVGAASQRLYLSYPRLEVAEARARVPSFYALDVARSITGYVPNYVRYLRPRCRTGRCEPAGVASTARPV